MGAATNPYSSKMPIQYQSQNFNKTNDLFGKGLSQTNAPQQSQFETMTKMINPVSQSIQNLQIQNHYYNYLNSFYNDQDFQGTLNTQTTTSQRKKMTQLEGGQGKGGAGKSLSSQANHQQNGLVNKDKNFKISNPQKTHTQIISLKKGMVNKNDNKYSAYILEPGRQAITNIGYQTQQNLPLTSYTSQSLYNNNQAAKVESQRAPATNDNQSQNNSNKKQQKPSKVDHRYRKSMSKENQLTGSFQRILSIQQDSVRAFSKKHIHKEKYKHKSRIVKSSLKNQNKAESSSQI